MEEETGEEGGEIQRKKMLHQETEGISRNTWKCSDEAKSKEGITGKHKETHGAELVAEAPIQKMTEKKYKNV